MRTKGAKDIFKWRLKRGDVLPKTTKKYLNPYKKPLQKVEKGYGYAGTVAVNAEGTHIQCHACGYFFKSLARHIAVHELTSVKYKDQFGLARGTALIAPQARNQRREWALTLTAEQRIKRYANLRRPKKITPRKRQSLEVKNKQGRCPDQLLEKIEHLSKKLKRTPSRRDFIDKYGEGYLGSIYKEFGTWNQAVALAGKPVNKGGSSTPKYTAETVIEALQEFYQIEGRVARDKDVGHGLIPSSGVIRRLFGTMSNAREAAGQGEYRFNAQEIPAENYAGQI